MINCGVWCLSTSWVRLSISSCFIYWLKKNANICIIDNIFIDVNVEDLNNILSSIRDTQVDEDDDNNENNVEDCDGDEDESIDEEDNFD